MGHSLLWQAPTDTKLYKVQDEESGVVIAMLFSFLFVAVCMLSFVGLEFFFGTHSAGSATWGPVSRGLGFRV